jgi:NAD+ synthase
MKTRQQEIIAELGVAPSIDVEREIEKRSRFLCNHLATTGLKGFVLGISGGQDSLLAGLIAQRGAAMRRAEGYEATFHAVLLPYDTQADREDALLAIETIQPDKVHDFNIKQGVDGLAQDFLIAERHPISDFDKGNVKARMRMIAQYAIAGENKLLVIGTDHAAEAVTGFFTKFGDGGADILPLSGLTKRQGKALLRELGAPEQFMTKAPTADLLDVKPGQADESELGITYDMLDDYLEGKEVEASVAKKIEDRYDATQHKRNLPVAYDDDLAINWNIGGGY